MKASIEPTFTLTVTGLSIEDAALLKQNVLEYYRSGRLWGAHGRNSIDVVVSVQMKKDEV